MNLSEMITNVNAECGFTTNIDTLLKKWANQGQKKFVSSAKPHFFSWLKVNGLTLTTEADVEEYSLSPLVDTSKLINIYSRERRWIVDVISRKEFQRRYPDPSIASGDPEIAYISGFSPFNKQPSSASVLTLVSSSISDTSVVTIVGLNQNGVLITEEVTLTGTTPVDSTNQFTRVFQKSTNAFLTGIVTITSNAGAVTNVVISPRDRQGIFPKITFYPTPSQARTFYYDAVMRLPQLVNNNDMSLIPEQFHDGIEDYMKHMGFRHKKDFPSAAACLSQFKERVQEAIADDASGPASLTIVGGGIPRQTLGLGYLGGYYPKE